MRAAGVPRFDLRLAFKHGHTFSDDEAKFKVGVVEVGKLTVVTGKLIACDAYTMWSARPFSRTVKKGTFAVSTSVASIKYASKKTGNQSRVGAAMVRFGKGVPAKWELATKPGQKISKLEPGEFYGYGVDAGTGCFVDKTAAEALKLLDDVEIANGNWEGYLLAKTAHSLDAPTWGASWITEPKTKANIVLFSSGWGDGVYASYWGFSKSGAVVCLVTDFGVYPDA